MQTRAAVLRGTDDDFVFEDLELDPLGPSDVLVRVVAAGMCNSDTLPRTAVASATLPIVVGHEGAGVVEEVGADVRGISPGDHVVMSYDSCGTCPRCGAGAPAYCSEFMPRNLSGRRVTDGGAGATDADGQPVGSRWFGQSSFASHAVSSARNTVVVDRDLPLEVLAPFGCGFMTGSGAVLNALDVRPGQSVVVAGAGGVGLSAMLAAKARYAGQIIVVDVFDSRLQLALELGATHVINGSEGGVTEKIREATGGHGSDYFVDTTGISPVINQLIGGMKLHGSAVLLGVSKKPVELSPESMLQVPQLNWALMGEAVPDKFIHELIGLWRAGQFPVEKLQTQFDFSDINTAHARSADGSVIKPVLNVDKP